MNSALSNGYLSIRRALSAILLSLLWVGIGAADSSLRCDGRIISLGALKKQVESVCGTPDDVETWQEAQGSAVSQRYDYVKERYRAPKLIIGPIQMERWTYDMGSNKLIRHLLFMNGELIKIETGERGRD